MLHGSMNANCSDLIAIQEYTISLKYNKKI